MKKLTQFYLKSFAGLAWVQEIDDWHVTIGFAQFFVNEV